MQCRIPSSRNNHELMNIIKSMEMKYTIVYVEDKGKYSVYKRFESNEWHDATLNKKISNKELEKNLEAAFSKREK
jgi:hypothetical protein